ncbi:phage N-6-adenine-methyltransferase [Kosakonia cowanii JCM 10956 = DSM 18146]|uniref:DNA (cytosine-5-)-methyltransferase n=1 Tax=Kosakonia cowanii JCM 10956 = DSM 18146 TaxID=1300165 RepID=A0A807LKP9_9ENTR|nr:phage N-6-adenine-methyltransferase [Kosakonia cowanii]APZ06658.1 phage N-6-adenine-methyltransferase [Kosakonia cowanii JCM 10956 = DSM 18146]
MRYGSVCSGIEAATVAWAPLGWKAAWFAEIEKFPSAVLAARWPEVSNLGDMTKIAAAVRAGEVEAPDVLVGGTPCQAFSIAGLRNGLADARGQLTLSYVELADAIDDKRREAGEEEAIIVWENVPGVLSSKDNAFGCLLAGLAGENEAIEPGDRPAAGKSNQFWRWSKKAGHHIAAWPQRGCVYGPQRALAWVVRDAQYFGVAQRLKRVFVVASARAGFDPAEVLFEFDGVRRDSAPRRESQPEIARNAGARSKVGSHWDNPANPHPTLNQSNNVGGIWQSNQELFAQRGSGIVGTLSAHSFTGGAGGRPEGAAAGHFIAHAFAENSRGEIRLEDGNGGITGCLSTGGGKPGQGTPAICIQHASIGRHDAAGPQGRGYQEDVAFTQDSRSSADVVQYGMQVRRLTPVECERLQGFPDDHTLIAWRGKDAAECPDGPRYKAIGNSMAVPVMRWIGERIASALPAEKMTGDYGGSKTPLDQRDLWRTPPALFASLNAEFCFQLDAAAAPRNALCKRFITAEQNTLETPWADYLSIPGYVWLNPPYSDITPFVKKASAESGNQIGTVMLVPADTSVGWFKEALQTASEVRFITAGRLAFINPVTGKPVSGNNKGSMLIIWHPYPRTHCHFATVDRDELMTFGAKLLARREAA